MGKAAIETIIRKEIMLEIIPKTAGNGIIRVMARNPWNPYPTRRPRKLTWYLVITQLFTLLGRLVGRAATGKLSSPAPKSRTSRRR